jgi:hypothetical protein
LAAWIFHDFSIKNIYLDYTQTHPNSFIRNPQRRNPQLPPGSGAPWSRASNGQW